MPSAQGNGAQLRGRGAAADLGTGTAARQLSRASRARKLVYMRRAYVHAHRARPEGPGRPTSAVGEF